MATWRARPKRGHEAGCVWASNAVLTWPPWTSMATQTPTLKRKEDINAELCGVWLNLIRFDVINLNKKQIIFSLNTSTSLDALKIINTQLRLMDWHFTAYISEQFPHDLFVSLSTLLTALGLNWPLAYTDPMNHLLSPPMTDRWPELPPHKVMVTNEGSFNTSESHFKIFHPFIKVMITVCVYWQP